MCTSLYVSVCSAHLQRIFFDLTQTANEQLLLSIILLVVHVFFLQTIHHKCQSHTFWQFLWQVNKHRSNFSSRKRENAYRMADATILLKFRNQTKLWGIHRGGTDVIHLVQLCQYSSTDVPRFILFSLLLETLASASLWFCFKLCTLGITVFYNFLQWTARFWTWNWAGRVTELCF